MKMRYVRPIVLAVTALLLGTLSASAQPDKLDHRRPDAKAKAKAKAKANAKSKTKQKAKAKRNVVVIDRVIAVVNESVILKSELLARSAPIMDGLENITDEKQRERRRKKLVEQTLDDMVSEELMVQAAIEAKLEVKQKEIDDALAEIKRQNKLDEEGLKNALAMQGYTIMSYKKDLRRQMLRMRAVNMLVRPKVTITDEDVKRRYDAMSRRSASVKKVRLHHVLIALAQKPSESELAAAKRKAAMIMDRARSGESFAELAKKFSDDPNTNEAGGDLGYIERHSIATEWEVIVFNMDKGEIRGPVSGPRGLHVFYVSDVKRDDLKAFDDLKEELRNELYRIEMDKQTRQWMEDLRKKAHIVRK